MPLSPEAKVMLPLPPLLASAAVIASRRVQLAEGGELATGQSAALPGESSANVVTT